MYMYDACADFFPFFSLFFFFFFLNGAYWRCSCFRASKVRESCTTRWRDNAMSSVIVLIYGQSHIIGNCERFCRASCRHVGNDINLRGVSEAARLFVWQDVKSSAREEWELNFLARRLAHSAYSINIRLVVESKRLGRSFFFFLRSNLSLGFDQRSGDFSRTHEHALRKRIFPALRTTDVKHLACAN